MPITYHIDPDRNLVTSKASGILNESEYRDVRTKLASDPQFITGMKQLADFRSVEKHDLTKEGYNLYIDQEILLQPLFGNGRYAIVTSSDLHFGLTRQLIAEMGVSPQNARVFRDMDAAKAWLFEGE
jgi:hypothetical protein